MPTGAPSPAATPSTTMTRRACVHMVPILPQTCSEPSPSGPAVVGTVADGVAAVAAAPVTGGASLAAGAAGAVSLATAAPGVLIGFACG